MNNDLISRSAAIEPVERREKILGSCLISTRSFKNFLMNRPTIDAEPVRHGRWVTSELRKSFGVINGVKCSLCNKAAVVRHNYCSDCGAKMEAEVQNEA